MILLLCLKMVQGIPGHVKCFYRSHIKNKTLQCGDATEDCECILSMTSIYIYRTTQVYESFSHSLNSHPENPSLLITGAEKLNIKPNRHFHDKSRTQMLV